MEEEDFITTEFEGDLPESTIEESK